jgi:CHAD domain-containing protein
LVELREHLQSGAYADFVRRFHRFVSGETQATGEAKPKRPAPTRIREIAPVHIYQRLAEVRAFEPFLHAPTVKLFHRLRIHFKRLRYTLEFFQEVLSGSLKPVIRDLKKVQDHLGELQDARRACELVEMFLQERQAISPLRNNIDPEPIMTYLSVRQEEQQALLQSFEAVWRHFEGSEFRRNVTLDVAGL